MADVLTAYLEQQAKKNKPGSDVSAALRGSERTRPIVPSDSATLRNSLGQQKTANPVPHTEEDDETSMLSMGSSSPPAVIAEQPVAKPQAGKLIVSKKGRFDITPRGAPDSIYIAFFVNDHDAAAGSPWKWLLHKCMNIISPRYEHCQISIAWKETIRTPGPPSRFITFSTALAAPSRYTVNDYTKKQWILLRVPLEKSTNATTAMMAYEWCEAHKNIPFNEYGVYINFSCIGWCCPVTANGAAYYCAEQVASALREWGIHEFADCETYKSTPDTVYDDMCNAGASRWNATAATNDYASTDRSSRLTMGAHTIWEHVTGRLNGQQ